MLPSPFCHQLSDKGAFSLEMAPVGARLSVTLLTGSIARMNCLYAGTRAAASRLTFHRRA